MDSRELNPSPLAAALGAQRQLHSLRRVLEKRVLLDASTPADTGGHLPAGMDSDSSDSTSTTNNATSDNDSHSTDTGSHQPAAQESDADSAPAGRKEVVVIDTTIDDAQALIDDLLHRADSVSDKGNYQELHFGARTLELYTIDGNDNVATIGDILAEQGHSDALHLVTHGGPGGIQIGADTLSLQTLQQFDGELQSWSSHFTADADILLYGCNVSYSETGESFILQLSQLTGTDIAASDDPTGSIAHGGDWDLEYEQGDIETTVVFSQMLQGTWDGLLAADPNATVDAPSEDFINETTDITIAFDNQSTDTGYGPFIDVVTGPGIEVQSVSGFLGATYVEYTFTNGQWVDSGGNPVQYHPYDLNQTGAIPLPPAATEGSTWYAVQLPFGSFTGDQPAYQFTASALLDEASGAIVGVPIPIWVRPGFMYGNDPLNNPDTDPPLVSNPITTSITPTVMLVDKGARDGDGDNASIGDDSETVTGPSEPVNWVVTVDIANLSSVENLVVTEQVPSNFYYQPGTVTVTDVNGTVLQEGTDYTLSEPPEGANNNAELVVTFLNPVTGTLANNDIVITYSGYVPDVDADGNPIVINDGADDAVRNSVDVTGTYQDQTISSSDDDVITATATAVQKNVALIEDNGATGYTPGDRLQYTLTLQVSDYMELQDLVLSDLLGDGLQVDPDSINFELFYNGTTYGPDAAGNATVTENSGDGSTTISVDISQELIDRGISDGSLDGDLYADSNVDGTTTVVITYEATIREQYVATGNSVNDLDTIGNQATIDATSPSANGATVDNGSSESIVIEGAESSKSVFAVNGSSAPGDLNDITVGDTVTFAVDIDLGTLDANGIQITDYLPLPVFEAVAPTFFDTNDGALIPGANQWGFGPGTNFADWPAGYLDGSNVTTSADSGNNSITWTLNPLEQDNSVGGHVQLLFTVPVQDTPFTDGLYLTNVASVSVDGTTDTTVLDPDGIQVQVLSPALSVTKGVIDTDDPNGVLDPDPTAPVTFDPAGTPGTAGTPPWSGAITSAALDTTPIDSDLSNVDAGDIVRFAITVENSGGSDAFDITISDTLPDGFAVPGSGLNLQVYTGDGTQVSYSGNLFSGGITLEDPSANDGAINRGYDADTGDTTDGSNVIVIVYDLQATVAVQPHQEITNTATLEAYGGIEGGNDYTAGNSNIDWQDDAVVDIRDNSVSKELVDTSINSSTNASNEVVIGETATYSLTIEVAEGTTPSASIVDTLDTGLEYIGGITVTNNSGNIQNDSGSTWSQADLTVTNSGQQVTFDLGDLVNVDTDNSTTETITITYEVLVQNVSTSQSGVQLNNNAQFFWDDTADGVDNPQSLARDSAQNVTVIEPDLQVDKSLSSSATLIDANDPIEYTIVVSHTGFSDTDAFDTTFTDTLPPELTNVALVSATLTENGVPSDISGQFQVTGNTLETIPGSTFDLLQGDTLTLVVSADVVGNVVAGTQVSNTATVDWTSISGDNPNERDGINGPGGLNDYESSDTFDFNIATVQAGKSVISSSIDDNYNGTDEAVIGELVTYYSAFLVPEASAPMAEIIDTLPDGVEFVSLDEITVGADIDPNSVVFTPPAAGATGTISFGTANLINIGGNNGQDEADLVGLVYTVRVLNVDSNQAGTTLTNDAVFRWDLNNNGSNTDAGDGLAEASTDVTVIEPQLTIDKTSNVTSADNGDQVSYTITITNPDDGSSTTAYDLNFSDPLPAELTNVSIVASADFGFGPVDVSGDFAVVGGELVLDPQGELELDPGNVVTITVTGTLDDTLAGSTISNTANLDWSSINGQDANERTGADGPGGALNDYATDANVDITVLSPGIEKTLVSTSQNDDLNDDGEATIGEIVTFQTTITLPEASLTGTIEDVYGLGFEFVDLVDVTSSNPDAIQVDYNQVSVIDDPGNYTVGFDFGTLENTDTDNSTVETVTLTYRLRVTDINSNVDGTTLSNDASLNYDTTGDDTPDTTISDSASVDVVEPVLDIDKQLLSSTPLTLGAIATYQITVQLDPSSGADAYNVTIEDALPTYLSSVENVQIDVTGGTPTIIDNSSANLLSLDISAIDSTTVVTITVDARVTSDPNAVGQDVTNIVDVGSTTLDTPAGGDDSDIEREYDYTDQVTAAIAAFDLNIDKDDGGIDQSNPAHPGDTVTYTFDYGNTGTVDATNVVITDNLPDYVDFDPVANPGWVLNGDTLTYNLGTVAAGATGTVELVVTIVDPLPAGVEQTTDTVTIDTEDGADPTPDNNTDDEVTPIEAAPDYVIDKIENFSDPAHPGDTVEWTIEVRNDGNQDGTGVVVTDSLPDTSLFTGFTASDGGTVDLAAGTVTWDIGDLAVGDSRTFTLTATIVDQVPTTIPTQTNTVSVDDDGNNGPDPTPDNNTDSEDFDITYVDLNIDKDDAGVTAEPGDSVVYTLSYGNSGTADASGVVITESLPDYASFDAANSDPRWVQNGDTLTLDLGTVAAGETGSVEFTVIIDSPIPSGVEETSNTTSIDDDGGKGPDQNTDDNSDDEVTPIDGRPDYVIDKIENFSDPAHPGDTVEWTIEVRNDGNQDGTGVVVTDSLPDTSLFTGFTASDGGTVDLAAGTVTWDIGDLAVGDSRTFTLTATIVDQVPTTIPTQTNTVSVDDDGNNGPDPTPDNNTDSEDFDITYVDLNIDKDDAGVTAEPGDSVVYTLSYGNSGTADASGVVITESLPDYASFDAANSDPRWVQNGDTLTLDLGTVAAGETGSVEFTVIIDSPIPSGVEETSNTTSIDDDGGKGPDQNTDDNSDDEVTPIDGRPDYVIDKIENFSDPAHPGDTVEWTIEVRNDGNQDGTGVVVTDSLPDTSLFTGFTASDGGTVDLAAGTVTWDIGDLAVGDSRTFTLTATIVDQVPTTIPTQTNTVSVDDDGNNGPDPTPDNNTDSEDFDITYVDLNIDKDDAGVTAEPGDSVVYTLSYGNSGTADASGVVITESLPDYASFDAANSDPRWVQNGDTLTLDLGTVAAGETGSVEFTVIIDSPIPSGVEETSNTTSIDDDGGKGPDQNTDDNSDDEVTPIDGRPDYVIDKIENFSDPAHPGDTVEWTIEVRNDGNQDGTGVVVTDSLPDTSLFTGFTASDGGTVDLAAGTVTWDIGDLAVGDSRTFTLTATIVDQVPTTIPTQTNTVSVDDDGNNGPDPTPDNNTDSKDFDITYVDLNIDKDDAGVTAEPGDSVVYTLSYGNSGTADASGVVITESLPDYASFDAANSDPRWVQNGDTLTLDLGTVAAGETGSVEFTVIIDSPIPSGVEETSNTTSIDDDGGKGPDQNTDDNSDDEVTPIDGRPDYVIVKIPNYNGPANPGDTVSWTIDVSNQGNQDGTGVVVTDTLPDTSLFSGFVASDGGVIDLAAGTVTWQLGDLDAGDSVTLSLSATVKSENLPADVPPQQQNSVEVTDDGSNGQDPTPDNNHDMKPLEVEFVDLVIDKDDGDAFPGPTDGYSYTLSYANRGNTTADNVVITETLPPNTSFDAANSTPGWQQNGNTFTLDVGSLEAGESGTVEFAVIVDYPLQVTIDSTSNTASIDYDGGAGKDPTPDNNTDSTETPIDNPGPQVDNITLSQLHWQMEYRERPQAPTQPEMYGRLISRETQAVTANLQGSRTGSLFDPAFGTVDGHFYPNDWSAVFGEESGYWLSPTEGSGDHAGLLQLDDHFAGYRADSLYDIFGKALISAENEARQDPLQQQLDAISRDLDSTGIAPILGAMAKQVASEP
ncbi:isopeptide-forming domain-containing fimbrial protein [Microbulbifer sp. SAOS-129_SWC]|uniref:isopeptide-forming domain-containing fimbrial protein n=1 Tax=Microbulbifer sp. SAOS-129_SWC TaxID=3145235 RepID=UPI0032169EE6